MATGAREEGDIGAAVDVDDADVAAGSSELPPALAGEHDGGGDGGTSQAPPVALEHGCPFPELVTHGGTGVPNEGSCELPPAHAEEHGGVSFELHMRVRLAFVAAMEAYRCGVAAVVFMLAQLA